MSKISLKHSGGNVVSLNSPTNAPAQAEVAFNLPNADGSAGHFIKTDGSGNLSFGAVTVGGASNIAFNNGNGIDFSATGDGSGTATSELLNDYEQGTWTPSLNVSATYSSQAGIYVKIGRLVYVQWVMAFTNLSGTGYPYVQGLPYHCYTSGSNPIPNIRGQDAQDSNLRLRPHTSYGNDDRIYIRGYDSSGNAYQPAGGTFWNNGVFNGSMSYYTTS